MGHQEHCGKPVMAKPTDPIPAVTSKWEYHFEYLPPGASASNNTVLLSTLGAAGWEAVGFTGRAVLLKRKIA